MNPSTSIKIATSQEDVKLLSEFQLTAETVVKKLREVIEKTKTVSENNKAISDENGPVKVMLPDGLRARVTYECIHCDHRTSGPGYYTIENINIKAQLTFDDHSLHQLQEHHYFGVNQYRVDPIKMCEILGLIKTNQSK